MRRALALGGCLLAGSILLLGGWATAAPPAQMSVDPATQHFDRICKGSLSGGLSFTITNTAMNGADKLEVSSITRSSGSSDFVPASVPTPAPIDPGRSASFTVKFAPTSRGNKAAQYTVSSSNAGSSTVDVDGTGIDQSLSAVPSSISFGNQRVGERSSTQNLVLHNPGGDQVTVTSVIRHGVNGGDFIVAAPAVPFTIDGGHSRTLTVSFQPAAAGVRSGSIAVGSNACGTPDLRVALSGAGVEPNVVVDPRPIDAGASPVGKAATPTPVTVSNTGAASLNITAVQVLGPDAADFALSGLPTMPAAVAPKGSFVFNIVMTPAATGSRSAVINVLSDDPHLPSYSVTVTGTGGAATPSPGSTPSHRASPVPSQRPTTRSSPQALAKGTSRDSLAVGLVIGGVLAAFAGLLIVRKVVASDEDD